MPKTSESFSEVFLLLTNRKKYDTLYMQVKRYALPRLPSPWSVAKVLLRFFGCT